MRMSKFLIFFALSLVFFAGCKQEDSSPFTGIKLSYSSNKIDASGSKSVSATYYEEGVQDSSVKIDVAVSSDSTGGALVSEPSIVSGGSVFVSAGSNESASFTVTFKASSKSSSASVTFTTRGTLLDLSDSATGYASLGVDISQMSEVVTVSTPDDLILYAKKGGYVIYIEGIVDMSRGMLPEKGSKSTASTATMDEFVKSQTDYASYSAWLKGESAVASDVNTSTSAISNAYKTKIQIAVASNTAIIGIDDACVRGGTFSVGSSNVIFRNLTIQDAVDPFPHHEKNDGWNAQHDGISISGGQNIWIDHCTFEDTLSLGSAANGEKWQVYDGLCDIKSSAANITISYCQFKNHDKTMLIGSSDADGYSSDKDPSRTVTLHHNYFYGCGQRLPMVRNTKIHIFNNLYESSSSGYTNQYAVGVRAGAAVISENNNFGGLTAFKDGKASYDYCYNGTLYLSGDIGGSTSFSYATISSSKPFTPPYDYSSYIEAASMVKTSVIAESGAGLFTVKK